MLLVNNTLRENRNTKGQERPNADTNQVQVFQKQTANENPY